MADSATKHSVLFICLGNICRSPIAEAVFLRLIKDRNVEKDWKVDSAAMGTWHIGKGPYKHTITTLHENGIKDYNHTVRQIRKQDFDEFDYIFGMDDQNISDLKAIMPKACRAKIELLGKYDPQEELIIEDPYFGDDIEDFKNVYKQCCRCCEGFLNAVS